MQVQKFDQTGCLSQALSVQILLSVFSATYALDPGLKHLPQLYVW